jgi:hypothetical protein
MSMQLSDRDFEALDAMNRESNAKMRETDFVRRLLPHLLPSPDGSTNRPVEIYVAAAGHPNRMIDVVADNNPNKVLFVVPPLIAPTPMAIRSINASPQTDISELAAQFESEITTAHPGAVIDNYVQRLVALNHTPADAISTVYAKMWAMIYKRYDIPLSLMFGDKAPLVEQELSGTPVDGGASAPARKPTDDLDEDDFEPL